MGCGSSKPADVGGAYATQRSDAGGSGRLSGGASGAAEGLSGMEASRGGSLLFSHLGRAQAPSRVMVNSEDGSLELGKGGSYIIGRKKPDAWEPGQPLERPPIIDETQHVYFEWPESAAQPESIAPPNPGAVPAEAGAAGDAAGRDPVMLRLSYGCVSPCGPRGASRG